jgi:hypothetical protein
VSYGKTHCSSSILHYDLPHTLFTNCNENKWPLELITATYCWQNLNKLPCMNGTTYHGTSCCQVVHKLITSLHSKCYQPSGMLIHRQNLYVPRSKQCTGCYEAQSHEPVNKVKKKGLYRSQILYTASVLSWEGCTTPFPPQSYKRDFMSQLKLCVDTAQLYSYFVQI